ncbi:putative hydrolase or acyltransferase of alpha/beta superfamily [Pseudomonas cichorii]|uniref:Putative hydrolase or acyltransferase of alpha/beta superfamily n=1 Tax=Pseudomonas cichorii TaxID=36746 RepID=A0A3M4LMT4_PSECI|nr:alpha/beta hydrolase [Pseudomonas cichorii]RMQ42792.1 putative hydrolase or acyltransferase of alpha/beta superfamily [Pseudomonas cichorii]
MINLSAFSLDSRIQSRLQFNETPAGPACYFSQAFEGYELEGRILSSLAAPTTMPRVLAIHGARSDYSKLNGLLYPLQASGVASLSFSLGGHNTTTDIELANTCLARNLEEALHFANCLGPTFDTVIGHSLGGALALKVAEAHRARVRKIVLVCPALYADAAYQQPFGQPFKSAISVPYNFLDSSSLAFLREFEGELMLVIGELDGLQSTAFGGVAGTSAGTVKVASGTTAERVINSAIPYEVIDAIEKNLTPRQFRKHVLPDCDHAVSAWLRQHPQQARELALEIARFINTQAH